MAGNRQYDHEYKVQAGETTLKKSDKLRQLKNWGVPGNTLYGCTCEPS